MSNATAISPTAGAIQCSRRRDAGDVGLSSGSRVTLEPGIVEASSAKLRSLADWNRCSGFFSKQRRTILDSTGETFELVSVRSGGSTVKIEFMTSTADSPENGRSPQSIS